MIRRDGDSGFRSAGLECMVLGLYELRFVSIIFAVRPSTTKARMNERIDL